MSDLLSPDHVDQFRAAMRDVADTLYKTPVVLQRPSGEEIPLLAGRKPMDTGVDGEVSGQYFPRENHTENVERWALRMNFDYLAENGMVAGNEVLIDPAVDTVTMDGHRHVITKLYLRHFRETPLTVFIEVMR